MSADAQKLMCYQKNRNQLLKKANEYYEKNKEARKEYAKNRYRNMSKEQKDKMNGYRKAWHHMQDEEKKDKMRVTNAIKVC